MNSVKHPNYTPTSKLVLELTNKYKYTMHYRMFKFNINLGKKFTKINSVYRFKEKNCLGGYIDRNTQQKTVEKSLHYGTIRFMGKL